MDELAVRLSVEEAFTLLRLLQAEEEYEGEIPERLRGLYRTLQVWLRERGLRRSGAGSLYLARE